MTCYKFLRFKNGQVISDWDESAWEKNQWRDLAWNPVLFAQGFYASECITDALQWFGNVLAEVEVRGQSLRGRVMSAHQGMRIARAWQFSRQDWLDLAIYTAELVLPIFESDSRMISGRELQLHPDPPRLLRLQRMPPGMLRTSGPGRRLMLPEPRLLRRTRSHARQMPPRTLLRPSNQQTAPLTASVGLWRARGTKWTQADVKPAGHFGELGWNSGAGDGNRNRMTSLEGWGSTIELRPRDGSRRRLSIPVRPAARHPDRTCSPYLRRHAKSGQCPPGPRLPVPRGGPGEGRLRQAGTGCGAAWLARLLWEQEAASSNLAIPTKSPAQGAALGCGHGLRDRLTVI